MIIVINGQGKVLAQQNEDLFQGSVRANVIDLVAPFATNVEFFVGFELPDGTYIDERRMKSSIKVADKLNVWKLVLDSAILKNSGIVTMQFRGVVGTTIICSGSVKLPTQKGVPYKIEDTMEISQYEELLALITDVKALLNNKADIVSEQFEAVETDETTSGIYYYFDELDDRYISVTLPENYDASKQYYQITSIGRIINDDKGVYLELVEDGQTTTLKLFKDGVYINGDKIVTLSYFEEQLESGLKELEENTKKELDKKVDKISEFGEHEIYNTDDEVGFGTNRENVGGSVKRVTINKDGVTLTALTGAGTEYGAATSLNITAGNKPKLTTTKQGVTKESNLATDEDFETKLDKKPDGNINLINAQTGKLDNAYLPSILTKGARRFAGTFGEDGIITASAYASEVQGLNINEINLDECIGYEFAYTGENPYQLSDLEVHKNDIVVCNGSQEPNWTLYDNSDKVVSVNGMTGAVELNFATLDDVNNAIGNVSNLLGNTEDLEV